MPNYKLGAYGSDSYAKGRMRDLCNVHNLMFESDFPLTADEIADATAPARVRHLLTQLRDAGVTSVQNTNTIAAVIDSEGIPRTAAVWLHVRSPVMYCFEEQCYPHRYSKFSQFKPDRQPFDLSSLCDESRAKVVSWVNKAVHERRRTELTRRTIGVFLNKYCDSNYMLHARWPALTMLFKDHRVWEGRMREVPRSLGRWRWEADLDAWDWYLTNQKHMLASEQTLLGASLITADMGEIKNAPVRCEIVDWRTINNEYL